jgi:surfactin synthase thioesterase subunit
LLRIADLARAIVRDVDLAELGPVVLVGHAIGGVPGAAVAELLGTRVPDSAVALYARHSSRLP